MTRTSGHSAPLALQPVFYTQMLVTTTDAVVSTNLHGLFVDRNIPQTIALFKSITQVRDRSLGFEK